MLKRFGLIFFIFLTAATHSDRAQSPLLIAVWIDQAGLWLWQTGAAQPLKLVPPNDSARLRPGFSPNHQRIGYSTESSLVIIRLDGSIEHSIALPRLADELAWLDDQTVLFNTQTLKTDDQTLRAAPNDDLWRADLSNGEVRQLCADGQGGQFMISPRRDRIALVTPGNYAAQTFGTISIVDRECQSRTELLTFPVVNTASSTLYYPQFQWDSDGSALRTAIPDPKLVYDSTKLTQLWRLPIAAKPENIGAVQADFFGRPAWSADGQWLTFLRRTSVDKLTLVLTAGDGQNPRTVADGKVGAFSGSQWLPDTSMFTYVSGKPGEVWIGDPNSKPVRLGTEPIFQLTWTPNSTVYFYVTTPGLAGSLRFALRGQMQPQTIASVNNLRDLIVVNTP